MAWLCFTVFAIWKACTTHSTKEVIPHTYILNTFAFSLVGAWQNATNWLKKDLKEFSSVQIAGYWQ